MSGQQVELERVGMVYQAREGAIEALRTLSLSINEGEFVSLLGPSGCGKSTLLMIVAGLLRPSFGRVTINGRLVDRPQVDVGIVFQNPVLLDWRRVLDNVMLQVEARSLPREAYRQRARDLLARVGLAGFERSFPFELSGGMSQRVSVCRALVHDPPLLLMDEPFGQLDALTRDQMMIDLHRLWSGSNKTVVFVTHSIPEAIFLSDRVVVMTPRPGQIDRIVEVDLPRPRRLSVRTTEAFVRQIQMILEIFQARGILVEELEDNGEDASPSRRRNWEVI